MFRELLLISTILGVASLGTEIVFRFRPDNNNSEYDVKYNNQSNVLLAATAVEIIASVYSTRTLESMTPKKMKCITVIVMTGLIIALVFRSMYGLFHPLNDSQFNLFNATSFFVCLTTFIWCLFWFFQKEEPSLRPTITLGEINERERLQRAAVTRAADDHYHIDDEPLPSYYELPVPPKYVQQQDLPNFTVTPEAHSSTQNTTTTTTTTTTTLPDYPTSSSTTLTQTPPTTRDMVAINTLPENPLTTSNPSNWNTTTSIEIPSPTATVISILPEPPTNTTSNQNTTTTTTTINTNPIIYSNVQTMY